MTTTADGGVGHEHEHESHPRGHADHEHDHDHDHDRDHDRDRDRDHDHGHGPLAKVGGLLGIGGGHSHDAADSVDSAMESSDEGIRAVKWSLAALGLTAALQIAVVVASGSVALLGDALHNVADALTAVPLWFAFTLGKRTPTTRYTYGYGRAEDLAGLAIIGVIAGSSAIAGYESVLRLLHPHPVRNLPFVAAAALVGFAGNELVARYRIRAGRRIGSAALVADGLHARTDGLTSLAVLAGAGGVWLGSDKADAIVGLVITVAIVAVLRNAAREIYRRLMDAVDPELVEMAGRSVLGVAGVAGISDLRIRWIGHRMRAEVEVDVADDLSVVEGHAIADRAYHALLHDVPRLAAAVVHVSPVSADVDHHSEIAHHLDKRR